MKGSREDDVWGKVRLACGWAWGWGWGFYFGEEEKQEIAYLSLVTTFNGVWKVDLSVYLTTFGTIVRGRFHARGVPIREDERSQYKTSRFFLGACQGMNSDGWLYMTTRILPAGRIVAASVSMEAGSEASHAESSTQTRESRWTFVELGFGPIKTSHKAGYEKRTRR